MDADPTQSLTGLWHGRYGYTTGDEPTGFTATLAELGGTITGATEEQARVAPAIVATLQAAVAGRREGVWVSFLKTYDGTLGWRHSIRYEGVLNAEGTEIEGRWVHSLNWTGWFLMIRAERPTTAAETRASEKALGGSRAAKRTKV